MNNKKVAGIGKESSIRDIDWLHMPISDGAAPDHRFEQAWVLHAPHPLAAIRDRDKVIVHCKGGLGRAGTVAALMLVELGMVPDEAICAVRDTRARDTSV